MEMHDSSSNLNIAATCTATRALGPGIRSAVWVQGCPFSCPGCISPEWQENRTALQYHPAELAGLLVSNPAVTGITISGGEPFAQADALSKMITIARNQRELDVICFTGHTLEELVDHPEHHVFVKLLRKIDLLVDGRYRRDLDTGIGLRGSGNQRFIFLSNRLRGYDFENMNREIEIQIQDGEIFQIGIPRRNFLQALENVLEKIDGLCTEAK